MYGTYPLSVPREATTYPFSCFSRLVAPQFKETTPDTITTIVSRYYEQDTWKKDLIFRQESFDLLQDILEDAGELKKRAPYKNLVTTIYAEKSAKTVKDTTISH